MATHTLKVETASSHCTTPTDRNDQLVNVKVGCLHINPASTRGRRLYMGQMLALAFVPHVCLIVQNCTIMAQLSTTLETALYLNDEVYSGLMAGDALMVIQQERLLVADFLTSTTGTVNRSGLQRAFTETDENLAKVPSSLMDEENNMALYQLSTCHELLRSIEEFSKALTFVPFHKAQGTSENSEAFRRHQVASFEHLTSTLQYLEAEGRNSEVALVNEVISFLAGSVVPLEIDKTGEEQYLKDAHNCLKNLREVKSRLWIAVEKAVLDEVWVTRRTVVVGILILTVVLAASPVLILLLRHTVNTIQTFTQSIELSTQRLEAEMQKSDLLLSRMLPAPVLRRLRAQKAVPAESFDAVTIFFSDIVGFTTISARSTPMEIINMLNMLYKLFDEKITQYNVYKVETIGDAYMVVSGLPKRNGNRHASEIADMSLSLMRSLVGARVPHIPQELLRIRAGVNTGPCVAGVVGTTMPRYCLFGDTINTASRMESTGEPMKIHISHSTKKALDEIGGYETESRGQVDIAGKGTMETFWLVSKYGILLEPESPRCMKLHDYDQNLLELLIR